MDNVDIIRLGFEVYILIIKLHLFHFLSISDCGEMREALKMKIMRESFISAMKITYLGVN
jgi:hypothetical protein